jgi:7-cyano-7-deazaguanine synthase
MSCANRELSREPSRGRWVRPGTQAPGVASAEGNGTRPMPVTKPALILLSGGMDSAILLWWLRRQRPAALHALSIDYGQRHRAELQAAAALAAAAEVTSHIVVRADLTSIGGSPLTDAGMDLPAARQRRQTATVVPFRNMLFVTLAAARAETLGLGDIYIAPVRDDFQVYRDCRRAFYDSLEQTLQLGASRDTPVRVHTPFVDRWKRDLVALALELGVPLDLTHTCYAGTRPACGHCDACAERIAAFRAHGTPDPLPYEPEIDWSDPL